MTATPARSAPTTTTVRIRRQRLRLRAAALATDVSAGIGSAASASAGAVVGRGAVIRADDEVAAARQIEAHGVVTPFVGVVLDQAAPQAARLDADERVRLRIEVRRPAEHLDGDRVALQPVALAGERLLHDETQEARRARSLLEATARENALELRAHFGRAGLDGPRRTLHCVVVANGTARAGAPSEIFPGVTV